jgi:hypothetical protein
MGRYYWGDIEGKFWFAVQNSNAADRFGVMGVQPQMLEYRFDESNLEDVRKEINSIEYNLGKYLALLDKFFAEKSFYSNEELIVYLGFSKSEEDYDKVRFLLNEYADLELGRKIEKAIVEMKQCNFEAEF